MALAPPSHSSAPAAFPQPPALDGARGRAAFMARMLFDQIAVLAVLLGIVGLIALTLGEPAAQPALVLSGFGLFIAVLARLAVTPPAIRLGRLGELQAVVLVWFLLPFAASVPTAAMGGLSVIDALFDATSALTTTGATVFASTSLLPRSYILWHALMSWFGGFLTLLTLVLVIGPTGAGGLPDRFLGDIEHGGSTVQQRLSGTLREIMPLYGALTGATVFALMLTGLPPLDAVALGLSAIATGGLAPQDGTLAVYRNPAAELVLGLAMLLATTSILWQRAVFDGRLRHALAQRESVVVIGLVITASVIFAALALRATPGMGAAEALVDGFVTATSLASTTGFEPHPGAFALMPMVAVCFIVFVGGATYTTTGGIKVYRLMLMTGQLFHEVFRLIYPHGVKRLQIAGEAYDPQTSRAVWTALFAWLVAFGGTLFVTALAVPDFAGAYLAALAIVSNMAPLYEASWNGAEAGWPGWAEFPAVTKLALCAAMVVGRLEVIAVMVVLYGLLRRR